MMKKTQTPDEFWAAYEKRYSEKVLAQTMGQCASGWTIHDVTGEVDEADAGIWGLVVATTGGFRFLPTPSENWIAALFRFGSGAEAPREREIFVPYDRIVSAEELRDKSLIKRFLGYSPPVIRVIFRDLQGTEQELRFEVLQKAGEFAAVLNNALKGRNDVDTDSR